MKESDLAKVVYAKIIDAVNDVRSDMKQELEEQELWDLEIGFPDSVTINDRKYVFCLANTES